MTRILIGECKQEVSTFNPVVSSYADFDVSFGAELLDYHRDIKSEIGGALHVFAHTGGIELFPAYSARAITSGGTLAAESFRRIGQEFLAAVRAAPPVDGIYFSLHGAMSAEGEDDPEGWLLAETRKIVGEQIPIVVSLDLHGVLTDRMLQHSDAIVAYHTYPHVDFYQTGERSARLLLRILRGEAKPVTARARIPALVRGPELITETGLFGQMIRQAQSLETSDRGLSAGMFIGNPFTDVRDLASSSFVVANSDADWATGQAMELANDFWSVREQLYQPLISLEEATASAKADLGNGTVVFVDAADATSSGASGDSNVILRGLVESGYSGRVLAPVVDAPAVEQAMEAGIGNRVRTTIGGQLDRQRFTPLPVEAQVRLLSDGRFANESHGSTWNAGPTAVLEAGNLTIVATSRPVSLYDRSLFYAHGQDPKRFDAVVVKSPHCQHHMFAAWATQMLNVDAPGSTSANLHRLGHTRCRRPIFPLDEGVSFTPEVQIFQRR
ncbi:MAG: microcystin degradation protein MlrC [Chloroflexi bacterium]|nr:MAG: microcystin degradation protein MlrC [Chloroflexota bacterium]